MASFRTGQKVVCVKQYKSSAPRGFKHYPVVAKIYTIRAIVTVWPNHVYLNEVKNPKIKTTCGIMERCFPIDWFRPLKYDSITDELLLKFPLTEECADVVTEEIETVEENTES